MDHKVEHDIKYQQFTIILGDEEAELAYATPSENIMDFTHTFVPEPERGKGIGDQLIKTGLQYAAENALQVVATCTAVKAYIRRHPEYERLLKQQ